MNELSLNYLFAEQTIRTVVTLAETWFVLKDVCEFFGEKHYRRFSDNLDDDEKGVTQIDTPGGKQNMIVVNEFGLYHTLFLMEPEKARNVSERYIQERQEKLTKFRRWVTHEVLPSIRKQGFYSLMSDEDLVAMLTERQKRNPKALECIDKQKIKQSIVNEKRESAMPIIQEAWHKRFIEKDKSVDFPKILREHTMGDSPMYHKYYDRYMSAYNRELRGWEVKELE